ncbi:efflux RND transporter permease subunit [Thalassotalea agarivorans]|uniref:Multidrug efflux pump subunit AcrB n=1 Tax=Thalassotalea agarivorans TaxID=349064 RepID=A0A1I0AD97_THASX|nr:efflux RND transporter permease subunit [Thalassotalea agarivorans]SES92176.1 Multidrug efflux pump subunit AcrB [Thalassotalea agarivorans]
MDFARYSIKTPVNIWLMVIICLIGGWIGLQNIGRLEDPAFTIKLAQVITHHPGASAAKVEKEVTEPLEIALQQMSQVYRLISKSKPGYSEITVEIKHHYDGKDLPQIWDEMRKKLRDATATLPAGASQPYVYDEFGEVFGLYYALTAPDFTPRQMREISRIIRRELLTTEGVAKVQVNGVLEEQLVAYMDPYRIAGLGISFPDVVRLLQDNLRPFNGGRIKVEDKQIRLLVEDASSQLEEINNLAIVLPGSNASVRVKDLAELKIEPVDIQSNLIRYQGNPAITLSVAAVSDVNIVAVGKRVNDKVDALLQSLPAGITLEPIYDQAAVVDESVAGFINNLFLSVVVVVITLCLFMGWRSGIVVGSILLITVLGTILIMWLSDLQLQRISLGAMVIAMGMLVDNAIVVAEGMMMRMQQGRSAMESASFIVKRTQWPLLGATVIGIAAFSGIGLSDDQTGEFLFSLFAVVLISLMLSWILAVSVTPLFGSYFYKVGDSEGAGEVHKGFLYSGYTKSLLFALRNRWLTMLALLALTIGAYASFAYVKQGFFPPSNAPLFFVHYWGPQDRDIRSTEQRVIAAEKVIAEFEQVDSISTFIGRGADRFTLTYNPELPNESYALFIVRTADVEQIDALAPKVMAALKPVDQDANFYMERMQFGPGGGAKLVARFSGRDIEVLRDLGEQAKTIYREDGLIIDIRDDWREKGLVLNTHFDEFNAGISGVSRTDFTDAVQFASTGMPLGRLRDGDYTYPIVAKMSVNSSDPVQNILNSQVWSSQQRKYIPFRQLTTGVALESEDVIIHRRDRVRTISVMADPAVFETATEARARILEKIESIPLPDGYKLEWGGEYENSSDAQKALGKGLPAGFLVMLLCTVVLFGRVRQPLIVWSVVPMAVVGVVAGLLGTDMPFGFMSLLGFLSLFGMLIKNAIVLLEEIDLQIDEGKEKQKAIVEASVSRLRPVSLAAVTTILGMAPLLADAFFSSMAITIMGGLAFATVLTLIAVPVLYSLMYRIKFNRA